MADDDDKPLARATKVKRPIDEDAPLTALAKKGKKVAAKKEQDKSIGKKGKPEKAPARGKASQAKKNAKGAADEKEKKVYSLPGQKRDPPVERDGARIFYQSLYEQNPGSEMAQVWMMENGLLPLEVAKKVFDKKQKRQAQARQAPNSKPATKSPKSKPGPKNSEVKKVTKTKKTQKGSRKTKTMESDDDSDDEPIALKKTKKQ